MNIQRWIAAHEHRSEKARIFEMALAADKPALLSMSKVGLRMLAKLMPPDAFYRWMESLPDETMGSEELYLAAINAKIEALTEPDCNCNGLGDGCPVCTANKKIEF